jgi:hypothetical protein
MHVAAVTAAKNFRGPLVGFPKFLLCPIALALDQLALGRNGQSGFYRYQGHGRAQEQ